MKENKGPIELSNASGGSWGLLYMHPEGRAMLLLLLPCLDTNTPSSAQLTGRRKCRPGGSFV